MRWSAAYIILFALTMAASSFDLVMSLEPHWFSTIFGIYMFAGAFLSCLALITILVLLLRERSDLKHWVSDVHITFLAKMMFAFCIFWAYIWFSQFMLIWYANIPEETSYYIARWQNGYRPLFYANLALNWLLPFFLLMGYKAKRNMSLVFGTACLILLAHWLDLYLMVMPSQHPQGPLLFYPELGIFAGVAALFVAVVLKTFESYPVVPINDPLLAESKQLHE